MADADRTLLAREGRFFKDAPRLSRYYQAVARSCLQTCKCPIKQFLGVRRPTLSSHASAARARPPPRSRLPLSHPACLLWLPRARLGLEPRPRVHPCDMSRAMGCSSNTATLSWRTATSRRPTWSWALARPWTSLWSTSAQERVWTGPAATGTTSGRPETRQASSPSCSRGLVSAALRKSLQRCPPHAPSPCKIHLGTM